VSVARQFAFRDVDAPDGLLFDFNVERARLALRDATADLQEKLGRLNARPGRGINFALVFEIVSAEEAIAETREMLKRIDPSTTE
jgi:hypothetical protein